MQRPRPAPLKAILANTPDIEVWPAGLLRARSNHDARALARSRHVLRRKRDGVFLAADMHAGLLPLVPWLRREPGLDAALDALEGLDAAGARIGAGRVGVLPVQGLQQRMQALGIDAGDYAQRSGLPLVPEPDWLAFAGRDRYRRPLWLRIDAARAWLRMQDAALRDGIVLDAISGYRSHDYQLGIFERKRARGLTIDRILAVNAAPGFSEHHGGCAVDIGTPGEPAAEESFEATPAFQWLRAHAPGRGFAMSYPRGNPHGIAHEPWHWRFSAA